MVAPIDNDAIGNDVAPSHRHHRMDSILKVSKVSNSGRSISNIEPALTHAHTHTSSHQNICGMYEYLLKNITFINNVLVCLILKFCPEYCGYINKITLKLYLKCRSI